MALEYKRRAECHNNGAEQWVADAVGDAPEIRVDLFG